MEPTQSVYGNFSTAVSETTTKHNSNFCHPFNIFYFETVGSSAPYVVNAALNVPVAIVTTFANSLVFSAVRHSASIRLPSKLLLCSLVLTDLGVGLVAQPQLVMFLITKVKGSSGIGCVSLKLYTFASSVLTSASVLTVISLDRYIALFFHLKYHEIATTRRVCVVIPIIWSFGLFFSSTLHWNGILLYSAFVLFGPTACFLVIPVAYIKIYRGLRHPHGHQVQDQAQVQAQQQAGNTLDLAKYRRSTSSMLCIYGLFILCYLPYFCVSIIKAFFQLNAFIQCIYEFSSTVVYLNSCLNPMVYCFCLPEIRAEVRKTLRKLSFQSPQR